jgi:hypothetical protein
MEKILWSSQGGIAKAYGKDSKCSNILVVCYFKMGSKMQNVVIGNQNFPYVG